MVRSEGLYQWKIPVTPSGIEPATFRFVAQHLNHCATAVPGLHVNTWLNTWCHPTKRHSSQISTSTLTVMLYRLSFITSTRSHSVFRDFTVTSRNNDLDTSSWVRQRQIHLSRYVINSYKHYWKWRVSLESSGRAGSKYDIRNDIKRSTKTEEREGLVGYLFKVVNMISCHSQDFAAL